MDDHFTKKKIIFVVRFFHFGFDFDESFRISLKSFGRKFWELSSGADFNFRIHFHRFSVRLALCWLIDFRFVKV